jgi:hypothetical protein
VDPLHEIRRSKAVPRFDEFVETFLERAAKDGSRTLSS